AVGVGVVGERVAADGGVLGGDRRVVLRHRGIVHRGDVDADGGDIAVGHAVIGLVGEAVGAVVVGGRRVGERAVGVQRQAAVGGAGDQHRAQGVAIGIGVVGQHVAADRRVLGGASRVVL